MRKALIISCATVGSIIFFSSILFIISGIMAYSFFSRFSHAAQESSLVLAKRFISYRDISQVEMTQPVTYLLLGLDTMPTRIDQPPMTDTIMLVSLWPGSGTIATTSIPRDLYLDDYKIKVNALYANILIKQADPNSEDAKSNVAQIIANLTNTKIDETIIFTLDDVASLVDAIGGLTVNVETSFKDELFPIPDVDITKVKDPKLLYKTIEFKAGSQTMDGARILEYVRSRHSTGIEGNDVARNKRQQQVIAALITKLSDSQVLQSPEFLGNIYRFYHDKFESQLPPSQVIPLIKSFIKSGRVPELKKSTISIYPEDQKGVIFHPPERQYGGAWVFAIRDLDLFQVEVANNLKP